jgi:2-C-methyl-D-erythritol 4-phosphate cytidylyltransferase
MLPAVGVLADNYTGDRIGGNIIMNVGIIVAAGRGERMGANVDKAFLSLGPKPILAYSLLAFQDCADIGAVVVVVRKERVDSARAMVQMFGCTKVLHVVAGGAKRQMSVSNGLDLLGPDARVVAVHDGARPCVTPQIVSDTVQSALRYGSGVAAVKVTDTVKYVEKGLTVTRTVDRDKLWVVQTPQAFAVDLLKEAFAAVRKQKANVTDEASAVELLGKEVRLVPAPASNIKVTTADDMLLASALLKL